MSENLDGATMVVCASHSPGMLRDTEAAYGATFRAGIDEARRRVTAFEPDLVVFFGSDHRRAFTDTVPAIAVMLAADGLGDLGSPTGSFDVPAEIAEPLAAALLRRDFDVTVVRKVALDHGFGQTYSHLIGDLPTVPVIPIYLNCATPPLAGPARAHALGRLVGEELASLGKRILYVGSGGLSHSPPSLEAAAAGLSDAERLAVNEAGRAAARDKIDPAWDQQFLQRVTDDPASFAAFTDDDIIPAGVGAHEVRTWIAAVAAGDTPMEIVAYEPVPEWITGMGVVTTPPGVSPTLP
ncbi:3-carboxyethylcatechol 2,3-dioxygenase [Nocardioides sp. BP30]|uniref:3-carboxyethylcatechol 2,3-dioxygenase n=1 Tax=Nocardioides sp. BP30 TaxID=3036374 RepID=UPI0024686BDB|nr:3-carboxyethylcatechol 2,3-dioxygenase [Nocardioides sp. BP30]WGL54091.1 3-carboxyethylcatechol 2,3-dioxygenase [Nocardioides sp. BP30]